MKLYVRTAESAEPTHEGNVGIWWYYNGKVVGEFCSMSKGVEHLHYIQFDNLKNHMTEWESVIKEQLPEVIDLIPKGYRSIERGRVVYDPLGMVYMIICSPEIASNENAIELIAEEFGISDLRYDVIPTPHYTIPTYTGNPTLDNFDFGD